MHKIMIAAKLTLDRYCQHSGHIFPRYDSIFFSYQGTVLLLLRNLWLDLPLHLLSGAVSKVDPFVRVVTSRYAFVTVCISATPEQQMNVAREEEAGLIN